MSVYMKVFLFSWYVKNMYIYIYGRYVSIRVFLVYIFVISIYKCVYANNVFPIYINTWVCKCICISYNPSRLCSSD